MLTSAFSKQLRGFEGVVLAESLHDLIQMQCLGMHTRLVRVEKDAEIGELYFSGGQLVHAELGSTVGEEAFFLILNWPTGAFHIEEGIRAPDETITCHWEHLLMDAAHRRDEINQATASNTISPFPALKQIAMPESPLTEAFNDPEVLRAVHYDAEATLLECKAEEPEALLGTFCYVLQLLEHVGTALGAEGLREVQFSGVRGRALCVVNPEATTVLMTSPKANLNVLARKLSQS